MGRSGSLNSPVLTGTGTAAAVLAGVLADCVHDLLTIDQRPDLASLAVALTTADNPRAVLRSLRGAAGTVLTALAATGQPLTHGVLDGLPNTNEARYRSPARLHRRPARPRRLHRTRGGLARRRSRRPPRPRHHPAVGRVHHLAATRPTSTCDAAHPRRQSPHPRRAAGPAASRPHCGPDGPRRAATRSRPRPASRPAPAHRHRLDSAGDWDWNDYIGARVTLPAPDHEH